MATIDVAEGGVAAGLYAVLYHDYRGGEGGFGRFGRLSDRHVRSLSLSKGLTPILKHTSGSEISEIVQLFLINTVRTRAYHDAHHLRMTQNLLIKSLQSFKGPVRV